MTLLISEYVEGESWDKAIELFNYGPTAIDLEDGEYRLRVYHNGQSWFRSIRLKGVWSKVVDILVKRIDPGRLQRSARNTKFWYYV